MVAVATFHVRSSEQRRTKAIKRFSNSTQKCQKALQAQRTTASIFSRPNSPNLAKPRHKCVSQMESISGQTNWLQRLSDPPPRIEMELIFRLRKKSLTPSIRSSTKHPLPPNLQSERHGPDSHLLSLNRWLLRPPT